MTHVDIPADSEFGIDNLPYGMFSTPGTDSRVGVRYGDNVIDLYAALGDADFVSTSLNAFMARGRGRWAEVRSSVTDMLTGGTTPAEAIVPVSDVTMHLPFDVADYVDFYASEHHAANLGRLFRPDAEPLLPNWKHLPVAYHGRAGTVVVSGTDITRPRGQRKAPDEASPTFGPSRRLDIEAEMGFVVGVPSDGPISPDRFSDHVFGAVIVNDWSARDIQAWEYVPLGPNLGKSFATSISPWVVPLLALEQARVSTPVQDPEPLEYLRESRSWALDIDLAVAWNGHVVSHPPYSAMYWSPAQMLAHETVNGATSRTGDLFASGTISGPEKNQRGAFIELTWGGAEPVSLGSETRTFLEDGDEVVIAASAPGPNGSRIGFGDVRGRIKPA
ncbi:MULTISPECIES: fumarylacetoacetase [unclassified Rhodococcus (in: high G+C Gram-positive bacteria)]|uniref:fumarylacetoacetase n=1 Tax=unclassified Rhodococcus (in: high G+C Gram-positive bacteria) TaxID=192944 RepID=UPI000B9B9CE0|nr:MULTISPECIES: fumarylacetoacetase [unclassified Rhodococcus (in: high G+C Gram-positive bacteria)]OZE40045.1 fumarylacetoacetase [Rhodococcus sp. 05-2254-4]OZE49613.1 fumarylacetoacetase [Rhodococcus sp. 05-2254-3]OZE50251.1 fumarylacetoacetase [Rhodococcus sp. 05-2254-2]